MLSDFKMITQKFPQNMTTINIYPIADVHVGSAEFNEVKFKEWVKAVTDDENGYIVIAGDMLNNGIKNSKTNVYEEVMRPREQKEYVYEKLLPLKDRILACVGGNHEARNIKEVDSDPLYEVMCRLNLAHIYRSNACFVKIALGTTKKKPSKQTTYGIVVTHGTGRNRHNSFMNGVDGADLFISGHTHQDEYSQNAKVRFDMHNECVTTVPYRKVICTPFCGYGGYALKAEFLPGMIDEFQVVRLDGTRKKINFFTI